ncbi:MAG: class I SAM-dependent methyltransferase, partial [Polyangiales bacterium]
MRNCGAALHLRRSWVLTRAVDEKRTDPWTESQVREFLAEARIPMRLAAKRRFRFSRLEDKGSSLHGSEPSTEMRRRAEQRLPKGTVQDGSVLSLPFADETFDFAGSIEVFRYLNAADNDLGHRELLRVVKPGGVFFGTYVNRFVADGFISSPGAFGTRLTRRRWRAMARANSFGPREIDVPRTPIRVSPNQEPRSLVSGLRHRRGPQDAWSRQMTRTGGVRSDFQPSNLPYSSSEGSVFTRVELRCSLDFPWPHPAICRSKEGGIVPDRNLTVSLCVCAALVAAGCSGNSVSVPCYSELRVDLAVSVDGEGQSIVLDEVLWTITGNGTAPMSGAIDTSAPGATPSVEVFGLNPGSYMIDLEASTVDGETRCRGSAPFDVSAGVSTEVAVLLRCKVSQRFGAVRVNGKFNICAELTQAVVAPLQTSIGNRIAVRSQAEDEEGDPIAYAWTADSGAFGNPSAAATFYTCEEAGIHSLTISVSDDGFVYCDDRWTVAIRCVDEGGTGGTGGNG